MRALLFFPLLALAACAGEDPDEAAAHASHSAAPPAGPVTVLDEPAPVPEATAAATLPDEAPPPTPPAQAEQVRDEAPAPAVETAPEPQTVRVGVTAAGFEPGRIELPAGVSSRLVFTRTTENTCATSVKSPDLGLPETPLPLGEPVAVEVRPERAGTYAFACGMDMVSGTLVAQ